ncbi:MAG: LuxR C-terminal-related transcriptional regulator [Anaerolineae bacterium]
MATPLLTTKLYMPPIRPELVPRPHLLERLNEGLHRKLIVISAPAGFGKTTLISAWIKESGIRAAWISLDENDNDPARFLAYLVAALRTIQPDIGKGALSALQAPQPPASEAILTALINQLDDLSHSLLLVLDDYHLITAKSIHKALAFFLDHLPPQIHVVIATRADPPLSLARLRGRGQLTELRQIDLRFGLDEATAFLNQVMDLNLPVDDIAALASRTEGWIAGLQMAALALQVALSTQSQDSAPSGSFVQAFAGSNRYILDYLVEEVLLRQPEEIQAFLLLTAILSRLTGPLCDAVLDAEDTISEGEPGWPPYSSQQILENLEAANLFIIPLDSERRWYRYHRLFADLLRKRLADTQPERVPVLHRRASIWYEQNELVPEAIDHALAAEHYDRAADLIETIVEATLMRSEVATLLNWMERLPGELIQARPSLCLYHAWALLWSGEPLEAIQSRLRDIDTDTDALSIQVDTLQALVAAWQGEISLAGELARDALDRLPKDKSFLRSIATWNLGLSYLLSGEFEAGRQVLDEIATMGQKTGNVMLAVNAVCHLAELQMSQARLYEARDTYQRALELATDKQGQLLPIAGMPLIGLGELSREWNDLEAAKHYVNQGLEQIGQWGPFGAIDGHIAMARIKQAEGDLQGARDAIQEAQRVAVQFDATELDDVLVAIHQVRLWLAQGNLELARHWLEEREISSHQSLGPSAVTSPRKLAGGDNLLDQQLRIYKELLLARLMLRLNRPDKALPLLDSQETSLEEQGRRVSRRMIEVQLLRALVLQAQDSTDQALASLERALSIAEPGGFVRTFVDEGEQMALLLRQAASRGIAPGYVSQLIAAFDTPRARDTASTLPHPHAQHPVDQPLIEPLSEREMDVLRLLSAGLSNPEIGQELFIATSTVRSHLKSIYGKLNVHKRWDAVHRAEELGLL